MIDGLNLTDAQRLALKRMPYAGFLKTGFWATVRLEVIARAEGICQMCGDDRQTVLQAHHRSNEHRGWEDEYLHELICLCKECHEDVERKKLREWPYRPSEDWRIPRAEAS